MKKTPEPIILAGVLGLLALGSALLAYLYPPLEAITGVTTLEPTGKPAQAMKAADIQASLTLWNSPVLWQEPDNHHRLLDSDEYLFYPSQFPNGIYIEGIGPDTRSPSGVPLRWYRKYGLDFTDPNIDREDPDNDGFSNIVEFKNDPVGVRRKASECDGSQSTNPLDPQSHPSYLSRLRLQKYELRPFHILFNGYQQLNGEYVFELYLNDVPSSNQPPLLKTGDKLGFEGYKIGEFHQNFNTVMDPATRLPISTEVSTLELDKPEIGLKVILPYRTTINSPESTADFVMLMPADVEKVIKIARGRIFTISYLPDTSFLVIDANDKGAVIRDTKTNQEYNIPKLDPSEWNEVPQTLQPNH
ncbi:MAG TPA: Amuc_1099 family pilus-like system protein [Candidatus Methylacidiphilales bacterium]|nr:Amuc_1099 family pilus-like system protein [Candidatus Methylacidiphilales bacterium]